MTLSLCERLDSRRKNDPRRLAYVIDGVERDNQTSIDQVFRVANGLIASGIGKGDRIVCGGDDRHSVLGREYGPRAQHRVA